MIISVGVEGRSSARCKIVAISSSAFFVVSPACKDGVVVDGGVVRIVIISEAAWRKKCSSFTSG